MGEGDDEGAGIARHDRDGGEVRGPALVKRLGPADEVEKIRVIGRERGREDTPPGVHAVLRRDGFAVAPFGFGPETERVDEAIGGNLPAFGERGHGGERAGFETHERVEQRLDQLGIGQAGDRLRIKVRRLGADAEMQDPFAVGPLHE